jgi:hypothetical protein
LDNLGLLPGVFSPLLIWNCDNTIPSLFVRVFLQSWILLLVLSFVPFPAVKSQLALGMLLPRLLLCVFLEFHAFRCRRARTDLARHRIRQVALSWRIEGDLGECFPNSQKLKRNWNLRKVLFNQDNRFKRQQDGIGTATISAREEASTDGKGGFR